MARINNGITQSSWQNLSTALVANAADFPHLEGHRVQLADNLVKSEDLTHQQAALTASKQEISKQLEGLMTEGKKLATFLRVGVKQQYGNRSEKLVEFGLQPLRTRRQKEETKPPAATPTAPASTPGTEKPTSTP